MAKATTGAKAPSKTTVLNNIAETTGLTRKEVAAVFDALSEEIHNNICKKSGVDQFAIPGLCKIVVKDKPAQPARKGVPNPFKPGELMDVAAKPARRDVKIRPLKALKDMVN